jgi:hypothetical protein
MQRVVGYPSIRTTVIIHTHTHTKERERSGSRQKRKRSGASCLANQSRNYLTKPKSNGLKPESRESANELF